jgi:hypothetical protein
MKTSTPKTAKFLLAFSLSFSQIRWLFLPLLAAIVLLLAAFLPWLDDPFGSSMTAWQIPFDPGWQFHSPFLNYGLLCSIIALCLCLQSVARSLPTSYRLSFFATFPLALLCLLPLFLFLGQMLCCNFSDMARIAQHARQMLLAQRLFLYSVADPLVPLSPFTLHTSTLWGRSQLLVNQLGYALLLPLLSSLMLRFCPPCYSVLITRPVSSRWRILLPLCMGCLLCLTFARACIGILYEKQAQIALSSGSYQQALALLDTAHLFLPTLDAAAFYHLERGQALYYLSSQSLSPEILAYLAATSRSTQDFPTAFQHGYALWKSFPSTPWISDELSETLEAWIASLQPLKPGTTSTIDQAAIALPWLQTLVRVDPANIYGLYLEGRISYSFHSYVACLFSLSRIQPISQEPALLSSIYTYQAFSEMSLGHLAVGRELLFKALTLDPGYRNNTAREVLSGLH